MMEQYISDQINIAKQNLMAQIVQQLEGRLATVEDGLNFMFRSRVGHFGDEMVYYKNNFIGSFKCDLEKNTVTISFFPE